MACVLQRRDGCERLVKADRGQRDHADDQRKRDEVPAIRQQTPRRSVRRASQVEAKIHYTPSPLRLVAAGAPDSGHRPASVFPASVSCRSAHMPVFRTARHYTNLCFRHNLSLRVCVSLSGGRSGASSNPRCIAQEKPVPADKKLDGRKKTSSNRNMPGQTKAGLRGLRTRSRFLRRQNMFLQQAPLSALSNSTWGTTDRRARPRPVRCSYAGTNTHNMLVARVCHARATVRQARGSMNKTTFHLAIATLGFALLACVCWVAAGTGVGPNGTARTGHVGARGTANGGVHRRQHRADHRQRPRHVPRHSRHYRRDGHDPARARPASHSLSARRRADGSPTGAPSGSPRPRWKKSTTSCATRGASRASTTSGSSIPRAFAWRRATPSIRTALSASTCGRAGISRRRCSARSTKPMASAGRTAIRAFSSPRRSIGTAFWWAR